MTDNSRGSSSIAKIRTGVAWRNLSAREPCLSLLSVAKIALRVARHCTNSAALLLVIACAPRNHPVDAKASASPPFLPTASIQELMDSEIDPAADFVWGSVGTIVTAAGIEHRQPRTEEQWNDVRRKAIVLIEATNLLVMPGRRVAAVEFPSDGPGVFSSTEIERKLAADRTDFDAYALALRQVAMKELHAIDRRDVAALSAAGEAMDEICEACHVANWYPHEIIPRLPDFESGDQTVGNIPRR